MFRQEALENRKTKWRGRVILSPGIPYWVVTLLCVLFLLAFLTFVIEGTYTRRVNVSGEITTWPRAASVFSGVQGVVAKQFVTEGQLIRKGEPIYQIDVSKSTLKGVVSENRRLEIQNQLEKISNIISRLKDSKKSTLNALDIQRLQYEDALKKSSDIVFRAEEGVRVMKFNMDNYRLYKSQGLINNDQLIGQIALYYQQQSNLLGLSGQNVQNALQITSLESQIQTQSAEFDNRIHQMDLQRYELRKELVNNEVGEDVIIRALSDGKIDSLSVTVGQMVKPGDTLLQVTPSKVDFYYLVVWVPNDTIPYISNGDRVNVRYEAFPYEKFGQFTATVTLISKVPASHQEMLTYHGAPQNSERSSIPYYKVMLTPERKYIYYHGRKMSLESGMKAQSTLFLEKRKIYQWMLSPFYNMKRSATGPTNE